MRRAILLLVLLALALAGCGGDDEESSSPSGTAAEAVETTDGAAAKDDATAEPGGGDAKPDGGSANREGEGEGEGKAASGRVDLTVDPGRIRGARVTATGAVQTLPPNEESHQVAQENGYSSINSFGEEAVGEEATNITFALVQYLTAKAEGDWATACARLYSVLHENLENSAGRRCPEAFGGLMSRVSKASLQEQARIDVSSVRRGEGNRAFVIYKTPDTLSADMPMYVEDGVWKVGALEAYVLTPDRVG